MALEPVWGLTGKAGAKAHEPGHYSFVGINLPARQTNWTNSRELVQWVGALAFMPLALALQVCGPDSDSPPRLVHRPGLDRRCRATCGGYCAVRVTVSPASRPSHCQPGHSSESLSARPVVRVTVRPASRPSHCQPGCPDNLSLRHRVSVQRAIGRIAGAMPDAAAAAARASQCPDQELRVDRDSDLPPRTGPTVLAVRVTVSPNRAVPSAPPCHAPLGMDRHADRSTGGPAGGRRRPAGRPGRRAGRSIRWRGAAGGRHRPRIFAQDL